MAGPAATLTKNTVATLAGAQRPMALANLYATTPAPLQSTPAWFKVTDGLSFAQFATAGTTASVPLFYLPGGGLILGIKVIPRIAFSGTAITGYTISVGTVSNATQLASAFDMTQVPSSSYFQLSQNFIEFDDVNVTTIIAQAVSTGANLNKATTGQVDIYAYLAVAF